MKNEAKPYFGTALKGFATKVNNLADKHMASFGRNGKIAITDLWHKLSNFRDFGQFKANLNQAAKEGLIHLEGDHIFTGASARAERERLKGSPKSTSEASAPTDEQAKAAENRRVLEHREEAARNALTPKTAAKPKGEKKTKHTAAQRNALARIDKEGSLAYKSSPGHVPTMTPQQKASLDKLVERGELEAIRHSQRHVEYKRPAKA